MASQEQIIQAVLAFVNAGTLVERQQIIKAKGDLLLTDAADQLLADWLSQSKNDPNNRRTLLLRRQLLARCRNEGIDAAIASRVRPFQASFPPISNELHALIAELQRPAHLSDMPHRIEMCQAALALVDRYAQPEWWAALQNELGNSLAQNPLDERRQNQEQAIDCYRQALKVRTRLAFPFRWAQTMNNLANVYRKRICGSHADNIEQAIAYLKQTLEVYTRQVAPNEWAMAQNHLANAYSERIRGERARNIEQMIAHLQQALQVYTRQATPNDWAMAQNNLANAYLERIYGERALNIEQAITHLQGALEVRTRQDAPDEWAQTISNLAAAYLRRLRDERARNYELAILNLKQVLQIYTRQAAPYEWAQTMNHLAVAYSHRIRGERAENLDLALGCYQQALSVYTRQATPYDWAATQSNLAGTYSHRIHGERAENLELAIHHLKQTLSVYKRQAAPGEWAKTMMNLALFYSDRTPLLAEGEQSLNIKQAAFYYEQALQVYTPLTWPQRCRDVAYPLGRLLYDCQQVASARKALTTAHKAVEALRGEARREASKHDLAEKNADLYARLVHCCLLEKDKSAAFEYALAGKGRAFVDRLASGGFDISDHIAKNPNLATDWEEFEKLKQEIDNIRVALTSDTVSSDDKQRLRSGFQVRIKEQATLWEDLTFKYPNLTATQQAPRLTALEAMTLAADLQATLVEYVEHAGGWSAFVVTQDTIQHVPLEKVDEKLLNGMTKWIKNLESKKATFFRPKITSKRLTQLYTALIAPLQEHLPPASQGERLIIAPFGALHQLPLNAAQNPDSDRYLSQEYTLTFTPSLAALRVELSAARQANWSFQVPENPIHIAHAGHPEMTSLDPLQKADQSASEMDAIFPNIKQLSEENATLQAAVTDVANRDLIHFYCHGVFEPDNPNQSGLLLHDGFLTVQRIITDLDLTHTHLVALAACQTGRVGVTQGEELVGLIQALLIAGSKSVVATLWKVDETPTQAFFQHFYRAIKAGHLPAEALTLATQAIRETEGWEHPYYWAAFQISGLGF